MAKVKSIEIGTKFRMRSGEEYEVIEFVGKSKGGASNLWKCVTPKGMDAVFTDWAILDKQKIE